MVKKARISSVWMAGGVIGLICVVVILIFYLQVPPREADLRMYQQAKICQDQVVCRQTQTALVLVSKTQQSSISIPRGKTGSKRVIQTEYYFKFDLADRQVESHISTGHSLERTFFDLPNIYLPEKDETQFAEINFPQGKGIQVEVWNDRITFIFADTIGNVLNINSQNLIVTPAPEQTIKPQKPRVGPAFAIPTSDHPLVALKKAQQDLFSATLGAVTVSFLLFLLIYHLKRPFGRPVDVSSH